MFSPIREFLTSKKRNVLGLLDYGENGMTDGWYDAKTEPPKKYGEYLVVVSLYGKSIPKQFERKIYSFDKYYSWDEDGWMGELDYVHGKVIYWRPLPKIPKEKT